jgi:hypothetical protein
MNRRTESGVAFITGLAALGCAVFPSLIHSIFGLKTSGWEQVIGLTPIVFLSLTSGVLAISGLKSGPSGLDRNVFWLALTIASLALVIGMLFLSVSLFSNVIGA